ncbi:hypothetical protein BMF94_2993 [Rhodotorula taiwanensis]|uniref:Uncharacterized protein n=1 Tax=Rhodotorula taiwanensis TaxID=741276 RepID=A0A2S5BAZ9_9BASI|nr:hypothetical protein BMF94_2993 [Rhodotorula taiwanensis]
MAFHSFVLSALLAFVTLSQAVHALHRPFHPARHDHNAHEALLPTAKQLIKARQAIAPSPTYARELYERQADAALVRQLHALESSLMEVGGDVLRRAEQIKRARDGDVINAGEMLSDPLRAFEHAIATLSHLTEPVREVLPILPRIQRDSIQAVLDDVQQEATLLSHGIFESRTVRTSHAANTQATIARSAALLATLASPATATDPLAAGSRRP